MSECKEVSNGIGQVRLRKVKSNRPRTYPATKTPSGEYVFRADDVFKAADEED
jgi:hypothetical protein